MYHLVTAMGHQAHSHKTQMCYTTLGTKPLLVVANPKLFQKMLKDSHKIGGNLSRIKPRAGMEALLGKLIFLARDGKYPHWTDARQVYMRILRKVSSYREAMEKIASDVLAAHASCGPVDLEKMVSEYTSTVLLVTFFGVDHEKLKERPKSFTTLLGKLRIALQTRNVTEWNLSTILNKVLGSGSSQLTRNSLFKAVNNAIDDLGIRGIPGNFIDSLKEKGVPIEPNVLGIFFAGIETTAMTLTYAIKALRKYEEVRASFKACSSEKAKRNYLTKLFKETLRLWPPTALVLRGAENEFSINNHRIPKGTLVIYPNYAAQRFSDVFHEPNKFKPARWESETDTMKEYLNPFGQGAQRCPAGLGYSADNFFAPLEFEVFMQHFLENYDFRLSSQEGNRLTYTTTRGGAAKPCQSTSIELWEEKQSQLAMAKSKL